MATKVYGGDSYELLDDADLRNMRLIEAAGGAVYDAGGRVLVIERLGRPDLPKGKREPGEETCVNAVREVFEETGLRATITGELGVTYHSYSIGEEKVLKRTTWFRMAASGNTDAKPQTEENITAARWVTTAEAHKLAEKTYASLRDIFLKL